jgi:hypothetical protein
MDKDCWIGRLSNSNTVVRWKHTMNSCFQKQSDFFQFAVGILTTFASSISQSSELEPQQKTKVKFFISNTAVL